MKDYGIMRASEAIEKVCEVRRKEKERKEAELAAEREGCIRAFENDSWVKVYAREAIRNAVSEGKESAVLCLSRWDAYTKCFKQADPFAVAGLIYVLGEFGYKVDVLHLSSDTYEVSWSAGGVENVKI